MLRPIDEALFDYEKTYRQNYRDPLNQHQQYTKRQLLYYYGTIGSEYFRMIMEQFNEKNKDEQDEGNEETGFDIEKYIRDWNQHGQKAKFITKQTKIKEYPDNLYQQNEKQLKLSEQNNERSKQIDCEQQRKTLRTISEELKRQSLIPTKNNRRTHLYRKQMEVLFKLRRVNMISYESIKSHFGELKHYLYGPRRPKPSDLKGQRNPRQYNTNNQHEDQNKKQPNFSNNDQNNGRFNYSHSNNQQKNHQHYNNKHFQVQERRQFNKYSNGYEKEKYQRSERGYYPERHQRYNKNYHVSENNDMIIQKSNHQEHYRKRVSYGQEQSRERSRDNIHPYQDYNQIKDRSGNNEYRNKHNYSSSNYHSGQHN